MTQHQLGHHYGGWNPQIPDHRDYEFLPTVPRQLQPKAVELNISGIPVLDQMQQGSCTGHGPAGLVMFDQKKQGLPIVVPAREMIYYDARVMEGTTGQDAGASVRDAVAGIVKWGVCPDSEFPYNDQVFDVAPSKANYASAWHQRADVYEAVGYPNLNAAIASGYPFVFGFTVYESFESPEVAKTGIVPIPGPGESILGGHCIWAFGYNASYTQKIGTIPPRYKKCRNSWSESFGDHGNVYLPQWYWDKGQATDAWIIRHIT